MSGALFTPFYLLLTMATVLFGLGALTFVIGVVILWRRAPGKEMANLAVQAGQLAQKGIAEDVAGLVGNASSLLDGMNNLVRTARGVGVFLCLVGLLLMVSAAWLTLQIQSLRL